MSKDLERFTPELSGQIAYEHRHRYALCSSFVAGKDVLDVACGEGYGAEMLAQHARRVVGVDIDEDTIQNAIAKYRDNPRLEFRTANCASLPFKRGSFDVVVSFETIEHIAEQDAFVKEAARVLRKRGGVFVVSTPNRPVYSEETGLNNPFHVKELNESEFRSLLCESFKHVHFFGQRFALPSVIVDLTSEEHNVAKVIHSLVRHKGAASCVETGVPALEHAQYFLAVCSNSPLRASLPAPSLFIDENEDLWREHQRVMRWASKLHDEDELLRVRLRESEEARKRFEQSPDVNQGESLAGIKRAVGAIHGLLQQEVLCAIRGIEEGVTGRSAALELAQQQFEDMKVNLSQLGNLLRQSEKRAADFADIMEITQARARDAEQAAKESSQELKLLRERAYQSEAQNVALSEEISELASRVKCAEQETEGRTKELEEIRARFERSRADLQIAQSQAKEAADAFSAAELECLKLRSEMTELTREVGGEPSMLRQTIAATKAKFREAEAQIRRLAGDLSKARGDANAANMENEKAARELADALEDIARKDVIYAQLTAAVTAQAKEIQRFEQQIRVIAVRRAVEQELAQAARDTRLRLASSPLGLVPYQRRLRSALAVPPDAPALGRSERREIEKSGLFDHEWYVETNPDVAQSGIDPLAHYLRNGFKEDRDPHPYFCSSWYRALYAAEIGATAPLVHYLRNGKSRRRSPHPLFDVSFYMQLNKDVAATNLDPLEHYINFGESEMRDPHPLIWVDRLRQQPGLANEDRPVRAYMARRELSVASPHPLFDGELYLHENNDVRRQGVCPLLHYCAIGWREGRRPHRAFAGDWYLANNPDVVGALFNPLIHFVRFGNFERRSPHPLFEVDHYLRVNRDARTARYDALSHYVLIGAHDQRETNRRISLGDMRSIVSDAYWRRFDPLSAFMDFGETQISPPPQLTVGQLNRASVSDHAWPPQQHGAYWLPQRLRDYIIDRYGEEKIDLYLYLMSVVDRYGDMPDGFAGSADFEHLKRRVHRRRSSRRSGRNVDVSIIIPVYNNLVFTLTSVVSILENASEYGYEIIIGDDCSTDATAELFSGAGGAITHVRHERNLGFLGNCNASASSARGG
jgi:ubiquinone/menaquinone biosynthesis C-methylase UbiE